MPRALRGYEEFTSCKVAGLPSTTLIQNELSGIFQDFFSEIFSVSIWQNIIEADFAFIIKINMCRAIYKVICIFRLNYMKKEFNETLLL